MDNCMNHEQQMDHHANKIAFSIWQKLTGVAYPGLAIQGGSTRHLVVNKGIALTDLFISSWPIVSLEVEPGIVLDQGK